MNKNEKSGIGRCIENGSLYEGQYHQNFKEGFGRYILRNGDYYIGNF